MWKCNKCNKTTEKLEIAWGISEGQKVDVLDYFCPSCGHTYLTFQGSSDEREEYWRKEWDD